MVANPSRCEAGFTYVGLVVFVAILGMVGAATLKVDGLLRRAAAEQELLEIGAAFSAALRSYAAATPQGFAPLPPTLQDLLKDPRFPGTRRHLRKIFVDPVTGGTEWGIQYLGDRVGVLAVYSLSQAQPLKVANFDARFPHFENKEHLSEWKFTAGEGVAVAPPPAPVTTPPAAPALAPALPAEPPPEAPPQPEPGPDEPDGPPPPVPDTASGR
jgi:type II secretory pathway pseudopilin PulG